MAALSVVVYLTSPAWLRAIGHALEHDDGPAKADIAVVLAGDYFGARIDKAADLVRKGYVPAVLVDGPRYYGIRESTAEIQYEVGKGAPATWFIDFPVNAASTLEEAQAVLPELQRRGVHSYLLVTSDYHTGRAGRVFRSVQRAMNYTPALRVVASHGSDFNADCWWQTRTGRKTAFLEWWKTFGTMAGQ